MYTEEATYAISVLKTEIAWRWYEQKSRWSPASLWQAFLVQEINPISSGKLVIAGFGGKVGNTLPRQPHNRTCNVQGDARCLRTASCQSCVYDCWSCVDDLGGPVLKRLKGKKAVTGLVVVITKHNCQVAKTEATIYTKITPHIAWLMKSMADEKQQPS